MSKISPFDPATGLGNQSGNFINLDLAPDSCGDITSATNPQVVKIRVDNVPCEPAPGTDPPLVSLPNCVSWRQPGSNQVCDSPLDAFPGSPSKCNCNPAFSIPVTVETAFVVVDKQALPLSINEDTPTNVTYTVTVTKQAQVVSLTITSVLDSLYGDVTTTGHDNIFSTTCNTLVGTTLLPGGSASCEFVVTVTSGPGSVTDTVEVCGTDSAGHSGLCGRHDATVTVAAVPPAARVTKGFNSLQCAIVRYDVKVENLDPVEPLTLSALADDGFGNITAVHDNVVATTCSVPQTIAVGGNYSCTFDGKFCASSHTDTVTTTVADEEGNQITPSSDPLTVNVSAP